ncbi:hypothetical protein AB0F45_20090 [Streptomyces achromogenes]|uniref:hypothetical protein n=1 Tax=Streptomyces achromogenes TaxID=67255 RepID=UPI0033F5B209
MDHFERRLAGLLRQDPEPEPFEPRHREALHAGVRARRRARAARRAAGCVLAGAGLGLVLVLWPHGPTDDRPAAPPRPATSPAPTPTPTTTPAPGVSVSEPPSRSPDFTPSAPSVTPTDTADSTPPEDTWSTSFPPTATHQPPFATATK